MTGQLQLFGEDLQAAGDLGDFGGAVFLVAGHLHELQVVNHDQIESVLALHAARRGHAILSVTTRESHR